MNKKTTIKQNNIGNFLESINSLFHYIFYEVTNAPAPRAPTSAFQQ